MPSNVKRKLAAIVFTDIAGFTKLSAVDEDAAFDLIEKQNKILKPIVEKFNGNWLKETGDGLVLSFPSSFEAVKCSIEIQHTTKDIEGLNLRIGIHQGDILERDGDIFGDDVNVASRIEPYAATGGIAISDKVQRDIASHPEFDIKWIAQPSLKGVLQEIKIYCITSHNLPMTELSDINAKTERKQPTLNYKNILLIATFMGVLLYFFYNSFLKQDTVELIPQYQQLTYIGEMGPYDISPDGDFFIYGIGGILTEENKDIFVQDISMKAEPVKVFSLGSKDRLYDLQWSDDGKHFTFNRWLSDAPNNRLKVPIFGGSPQKFRWHDSLSPDGKLAVKRKIENNYIKIFNLATGQVVDSVYTGDDYTWSGYARWSPINNNILFSTMHEKTTTYRIISLDDKTEHILAFETLPATSPLWHPNGESFYYLRDNGATADLIKIKINPDNGTLVEGPIIVLTGIPAHIHEGPGQQFSMSDDGKIIFEYQSARISNLVSKSLGGESRNKEITKGTNAINGFDISPDGKMVAYSLHRKKNSNIYTVPINGGERNQITFFESSYCVNPKWTPDGKNIVFAQSDKGKNSIWEINIQSGKQYHYKETSISETQFISVAPSGEILYQKHGNRNYSRFNPHTKEKRDLIEADSVGWAFYPIFSPDMKNLALWWNRCLKCDESEKGYLPGRGLWVIPDGNESNARLLKHGNFQPFAWSYNSEIIYASKTRSTMIYLIKLDGSILDSIDSGEIMYWRVNIDQNPRDQTQFVIEKQEKRSSDLWMLTNFDRNF